MRTSEPRTRREGGWALLTALLAMLLVSLAGMTAQVAARLEREREKEIELLAAGRDLASALRSYRAAPGVAAPEWPRELADLVDDRRTPNPARHLRRVPRDPVAGSAEWGLIREADRIIGVHSTSGRPPLKRRDFPVELAGFDVASRISDWRFLAVPTPAAAAGAIGAASPPARPAPPPPVPDPRADRRASSGVQTR